MYEADIQAAVDRWLELERKAAAWDVLRQAVAELQWRDLLARMDALVHPAQEPSKR